MLHKKSYKEFFRKKISYKGNLFIDKLCEVLADHEKRIRNLERKLGMDVNPLNENKRDKKENTKKTKN